MSIERRIDAARCEVISGNVTAEFGFDAMELVLRYAVKLLRESHEGEPDHLAIRRFLKSGLVPREAT